MNAPGGSELTGQVVAVASWSKPFGSNTSITAYSVAVDLGEKGKEPNVIVVEGAAHEFIMLPLCRVGDTVTFKRSSWSLASFAIDWKARKNLSPA